MGFRILKFMELGAIIKHDPKKAPKTGNWRYMKPEVDKEKCIGCATCVGFCPEASIEVEKKPARNASLASASLRSDAGGAEIDFEYCKGCGVCATVCPVKAIRMVSSS